MLHFYISDYQGKVIAFTWWLLIFFQLLISLFGCWFFMWLYFSPLLSHKRLVFKLILIMDLNQSINFIPSCLNQIYLLAQDDLFRNLDSCSCQVNFNCLGSMSKMVSVELIYFLQGLHEVFPYQRKLVICYRNIQDS